MHHSLAAVNAGTAGAPVDLETKDRRGDAVGEYDRTAVGHTQPYIVFWRQGIRGGNRERGRCPHDEIRGIPERAVGAGDGVAFLQPEIAGVRVRLGKDERRVRATFADCERASQFGAGPVQHRVAGAEQCDRGRLGRCEYLGVPFECDALIDREPGDRQIETAEINQGIEFVVSVYLT